MSAQGEATIIDRFYCPFQTTEGFSFDVCFGCKCLDVYLGDQTTIRCRKNKGTAEKRSFESAFLLNRLGWPWRVEIIEEAKK